jgi:hypothetical protein
MVLFSTSVQYFVVSLKIGLAERLALIRQQRAEAAKKREEEKSGMIRLALTV